MNYCAFVCLSGTAIEENQSKNNKTQTHINHIPLSPYRVAPFHER